jgi:hypothetical protein
MISFYHVGKSFYIKLQICERVYVGYLGSTQYYEWNYNLTDSHPATYLRNACYGWYIDVTTNNSEDYWHVDHDFERLTYMCL